eukprot:CAMPEP_0194175136 /NCGR_PEP_ID=MMETSP0154-20130528/9225_1 /TAXON_ID=1049557 /ORGANISM="Thalassiothrix antarctica, Strain L6-D1" /LENGTH=253 /DNA_ID=CAMNT_0038888837 /DNA_START=5 /DNA_END=766 /DNA_ORIENTATION=+
MSESLAKGKSDRITNENDDDEPATKKSKSEDSASKPTTTKSHQNHLMYIENPVSVKEFITKKLGCEDGTDSMHFTYEETLYQPMEKAPSVSRDISTKYLAPTLDGVTLSAGGSDCSGYAVVICDGDDKGDGGGLPKKERLFEALGLTGAVMEERKISMDELEIEAKDFKNFPFFQYTEDTCDLDDIEDEDIKAHQKITDVLVQHLTHHFKFDFGWPEIEDDPYAEPIAAAPILCGGRASDGNIVAVVAMRLYA